MTVVYGGGMPEAVVDLNCLKTMGPKGDTTITTKKAGGPAARGLGGSTAVLFGTFCLSACVLLGIW